MEESHAVVLSDDPHLWGEVERQVRQAGASFYAAKSDCPSNLSRVIGALLKAGQL